MYTCRLYIYIYIIIILSMCVYTCRLYIYIYIIIILSMCVYTCRLYIYIYIIIILSMCVYTCRLYIYIYIIIILSMCVYTCRLYIYIYNIIILSMCVYMCRFGWRKYIWRIVTVIRQICVWQKKSPRRKFPTMRYTIQLYVTIHSFFRSNLITLHLIVLSFLRHRVVGPAVVLAHINNGWVYIYRQITT